MSTKMYTAGAFAKKAGVSLRTIQYYDKIGVLKPASYSESGQRQYNAHDFERLQRILILKFLGFSLEEIFKLMQMDSAGNFSERLSSQKNALIEKMDSLKGIIDTIDRVKNELKPNGQVKWESFIDIIQSLKMDTILKEQYKNAEKLQARIRLHQKYSVSKEGWFLWLFKQMKIPSGSKILELGCGDASFWKENGHLVPGECQIILTDKSEGMLLETKENLKNDLHDFQFRRMNAETIEFEDNSFDLVIANHVLFYIINRKKALSEIYRVLKPNGRLIASTIGLNHMKELHAIMADFSEGLVMSEVMPQEDFGLQNGKAQLEEFFADVEMTVQEDHLWVTEAASIVDYVISTHGNASEVLKGKKYNEFLKIVEKNIQKNQGLFITKESGVFIAHKK